jgi:3-hydroxyisobutyrate dehydrogenase
MPAEPSARPTLGFVGLGTIGAPLAARLLHAGFRVQIYDFDDDTLRYFLMETGGEVAASPRLLAEACDIVLTMLPRPAEVRAAAIGREGVVHGFGAGKIFVDLSASPPAQTREIAKELRRTGVAMIDAPALGGLAELRAGKLTLLVGGEDDAIARAEPVLETFGSRLIRTGPVGSAHAARALCGQLAALCFLASAEALMVGRRAGLEPGPLLEALNASAGASFATQSTIPRHVLSRGFGSGLPLDGLLVDLQQALEVARDTEMPAPLSALAREIWATARLALGAGQDHTRLIRWLEQVAKIELGGEPPQIR